jgi:hypothetical protein
MRSRPRGPERPGGFALPKPAIWGYRGDMLRRALRLVHALATLSGAALAAGCTFALWDRPPADRNRDTATVVREEESGLLTGLFTRRPPDLPDAVPVPMREATLERGYGGVILRATGVAPTQGFFNATFLVDDLGAPDAAGVITARLVAVPPPTPQAVGPERTRLLLTAAFVQDLELRDVRAIRVVAAGQAVTLPVPARPAPPPPPPIEAIEVEAEVF